MNAFLIFLALTVAGVVSAPLFGRRYAHHAIGWIGVGCAVSLIASACCALTEGAWTLSLWSVPPFGNLSLAMDALSAWFTLAAGLVFLPVSVYSPRYMTRYASHYSLPAFAAIYYALFASIGLTLVAHDVLSFMITWELMSVVSYLIVNYEHLNETNTHAGYLMLAASEIGALMIAVALLLLAVSTHSSDFDQIRAHSEIAGPTGWAVFLLSFFGFGVKAGLLPSMSWLPRAHPAATANASALLSGVILNLGIYGIVRVNGDLLPFASPWPGVVVLLTGSLTAIIGILYATTENNLKRMLAHSSIENMGLITVGLGTAFIFSALGREAVAGIAYIAAFYHLLNHSLYKSLLFLGAGAVDNAAGTRDMNQLGGLIHRMPWTAILFLTGALSIIAIPPFNGFPSEWLIVQGLLRSVEVGNIEIRGAFAVAGALVALTAGLAVTAFVKAFGMTFLGLSRSQMARDAREVGRGMRFAMAFLAAGCLSLGMIPTYVVSALRPVVTALHCPSGPQALVPPFFAPQTLPPEFVAEFHRLGAQLGHAWLPGDGLVLMHRGGSANPVVFASAPAYLGLAMIGITLLTFFVVRIATRHRRRSRRRAWDGGLNRLVAHLTYTATGFSNPVRVIFQAILAPVKPAQQEVVVAEHFRTAIKRTETESYALDRWIFLPLTVLAIRAAQLLAKMHHGRLNTYVAYAIGGLLVAMLLAYTR
ncbi:proton-conducting transporter transmembrane domain-containing protein [Paraburkholderia tropica]|uniref:proton-conducting transporter transmembrane domain-containing protein n=1 Tax=Paraburkholderia tropica TaxID=92647 RepID=UPI002AB7EB11|nr:proton-conducting transporter membrane subunit [Paraburkholderia tropica]